MTTYFLNNRPLRFAGSDYKIPESINARVFGYSENEDFKVFIKYLEQIPYTDQEIFFISSSDPRETEQKFISIFKIIEAAGGLVTNKDDKILMIFRKNKWDLPKGKIDPGESIEHAAIREVQEECGIKELKITSDLPPTFHTYHTEKHRVLKKTFWFEMSSESHETLVPQTEEGITEVRWMNKNEIKTALNNSYGAIAEVFSNSGLKI